MRKRLFSEVAGLCVCVLAIRGLVCSLCMCVRRDFKGCEPVCLKLYETEISSGPQRPEGPRFSFSPKVLNTL